MSKSGMSPEFEKKLEALARDLHERGAIIPRNPHAERLPFAPYVEEVEANVAKTMAELLAEHSNLEWSFEYGGFICAECGWQETYSRSYEQDAEAGARVAHQAAALSAAGYGLVAEARAQALEDAADHLMRVGWNNACTAHLRARAAEMRHP